MELKITPSRPLLQFSRGMAHVDLWYWNPGRCPEDTGEKCIFCEEYTSTAEHRAASDSFPLQEGYLFLGRKTLVPHSSSAVMEAEYGHSFLTPQVTHYQCLSNYIQGKRETSEYVFDLVVTIFIFPILCYLLGRLLPTPSAHRNRRFV